MTADRANRARLQAPRGCDGMRLDQALAATFSLSRRRARALILAGAVRRNGDTVRVQSRLVAAGDLLEVETERPLDLPAMPEIEVLHHDRWLLVASKPVGVLSQSSEHDARGDPPPFDRQVEAWLARREGRRPYLRLIHRLDRLTSGAVLFAVSPGALRPLAAAWANGAVRREYLAVVEGVPSWERTLIDRPLARDPNHAWRFRVDASGRPARTSVAVVARGEDGRSLVVCALATGRTHQIRVHLADAGHPLAGDPLYDRRTGLPAPVPLLHAFALELPHPVDRHRTRVIAPLPAAIAERLHPAQRERLEAGTLEI